MSRIDKAALADQLSRIDIVQVIDERVPLKKSGAEYEACCPFHTEATPSFKVSPSKQFYHCFGCGEHGDAIDFVQKHDNVSFKEACALLGISADGQTPAAADPVRQAPPRAAAREPAPRADSAAAEKRWTPVLPVGADAPEPPRAHVVRGLPEATWCYRAADGAVLGYVYRFRNSEGGKEVLPLSWCRNTTTGRHDWRWISFPQPRPLYGLDRLAARPDAPVLLVEGEKCADAAAAELPDFVVVSWPGGGKAVGKTDWSPLAGRRVILWPDADAKREPLTRADREAIAADAEAKSRAQWWLNGLELRGKRTDDPDWLLVALAWAQLQRSFLPESAQPGVATMAQIAEILRGLGCQLRSVGIPAPGVKPDGWDVADAIAEGLTGEALAAWLNERLREVVSPDELACDPPAASAAQPEPPHFDAPPDMDLPPESIYTADQAAAGHGEAPRWHEGLLKKDGRLIDCRENVFMILSRHPEWAGVLWADEFATRIVRRRPAPWDDPADFKPTVWSSDDDFRLGLWLAQRLGLIVKSADVLTAAVGWVAREHPYNPVRDYLDSLQWDGVPRLSEWLTDYLGVKRTEYSMLSGRLFLISMVARIYQPGCQMRVMPILEGVQYRGKSSALRILGGDWYADTPLDLSHKDAYQLIQGVWLYEIAELDAFNRSEATRIKAWISSATDRFRAPYDRAPKDYKRYVVFTGSTNQDEYFKDQTGNTRFWPWRVESNGEPINLEGLQAARDQLFAEAAVLYRAGERWHATADEQRRLFAPEQEEREIGDAWEPIIRKYLRSMTAERVTVVDILTDCLNIDAGKIDSMRSMTTRIGSAMKRIGWEKRRATSGDREWYYARPAGWGSTAAPASEDAQGWDAPAVPAPTSAKTSGGVHVPF